MESLNHFHSRSVGKLRIVAILGILAVVLGAYGSHGLKPHLAANSYSAFQTGIQYHFYHTLAAMLMAILINRFENKWLNRGFYCFIIGVLLFSGSLYLLAIKDFMSLPILKIAGPITPIGGIFFILGWSFLLMALTNQKGTN